MVSILSRGDELSLWVTLIGTEPQKRQQNLNCVQIAWVVMYKFFLWYIQNSISEH